MRSAREIFDLILSVAEKDGRVRAVILNGSRANPKVKTDDLQDFDVIYFVNNIDTFLSDHSWIDVFGKRHILQMPDAMVIGEDKTNAPDSSFAYLMLFRDGNRIDLTLFPIDLMKNGFVADSLSVCLLDKDNIFSGLSESSDKDYLIKRPTQKEFSDWCNEFWWVCPYVAKGLRREEINYAKDMMEGSLRTAFMKAVEWHVGVKTDFSSSFGKSGKYMKDHISEELYRKILLTYPDAEPKNIWRSLFVMTEIFGELALGVSRALSFKYNLDEDENVRSYLQQISVKRK